MRRTLATAALALAGLALAATPAAATELVDDDKAQCPTAVHPTIQAGVDAASKGERVLVCDGFYQEAVTIAGAAKDGVQLVANTTRRATIRAPFGSPGPIVRVDDADRVQIRRFELTGPFQQADGACASGDEFVGVLVDHGSTSTIIRDNALSDIRIDVARCGGFGRGSAVIARGGSGVAIAYNSIEGYGEFGVQVHDAGTSALIDHNAMEAAPLLRGSQTAVDARPGTRVDVKSNEITDHEGLPITLWGAVASSVRGNRVGGNDDIDLFATSGALIQRNTFLGGGISVRGNSRSNRIDRNSFGGPCIDESSGQNPSQRGFPRYTTLNLWVNNKSDTSGVEPLCTNTGNAAPPVP